MLDTKFQVSEESGSEEEVFFLYFSMCFYASNQETPWGGAILKPETSILTNLVKD